MHVTIWDCQDERPCFNWKQTYTTRALWRDKHDTLQSLSLSPVNWSSLISSSLLRLAKQIWNYFIIIDDDNPTLLLFITCFCSIQNMWIYLITVILSSYALSLFISLTTLTNFFLFMDDQFRECLWCQTKWHGSTFECISSVSSLRIQVETSSELWDRRIHEIKWSTGCWKRLSSFIVWGIQAFATSTMVKRGQSFDQWWTLEQDWYYGSRYQEESVSSVYGNVIRYWFATDNIIVEDNRIHWFNHYPCPFIFNDSIWIWSM